MYIHNFNPVAFEILNFKIYWYSLSYLFGFVFSFFYAKILINKKLIIMNFKDFEDFLFWAVISVILGGRIGYVLFYNLDLYINNPLEILEIWKGGMSFHGGLSGLILCIFAFSKIKKLNFLELSNLVSACAPFGIFLGRLANFINGELVGRPTDSNWGVVFFENDVLRHPSQIYEAFLEGLIIFIILLFIILKKHHKSINLFAVFFILYGSFRFFLEFFREPDSQLGFIIFNLSMGQLLSIPMIFIGFYFLKKNHVKN